MLTDIQIERRCRYRLSRHNLRVHKVAGNHGPLYFAYEIDGDDSPPDREFGRYMSLWGLLNFAEELAEREPHKSYRRP